MKVTALVTVHSAIYCALAQVGDGGIQVTWRDYIWIFFMLLLNLAYFGRKIILAVNGYGISVIGGKDYARMRDLALKSDKKRRLILEVINYLVPISFILGLTLCIWARFL